MCIPEQVDQLTPAQRAMLLELAQCGDAAMFEGLQVKGVSRGIAGRLEAKGLVRIRVVGTLAKWEARAVLTDAGQRHVRGRLSRGSTGATV